MIKCICIDDKNRPPKIPIEKWVKEGEQYTVSHIYKMVNQGNILAVELYEKPLGESYMPFNAYKMSRFVFDPKDTQALLELAINCADLNNFTKEELQKLLEENLVEA